MFDQVVFAGGGNRCWWQAGFWDVVQLELKLRTRCDHQHLGRRGHGVHAMNHSEWVMDYYAHVLRDNSKNAYWGNLLRSESMFPHYRIYRQALLDIYGAEFSALQDAPEIRSAYRICRVGSVLAARRRG